MQERDAAALQRQQLLVEEMEKEAAAAAAVTKAKWVRTVLYYQGRSVCVAVSLSQCLCHSVRVSVCGFVEGWQGHVW